MTLFTRSGPVWAMVLLVLFSMVKVHSQQQPVDAGNTQPSQNLSQRSKAISPEKSNRVSTDDSAGGASYQSSSSLGAANGDYVLKPGDSIDMVIYHEPDLSMRSKIGKDGLVQLPLLGEVRLGGLTVRNATSLVREKYNADYLVNPQVYLDIAGYSSSKFTIIGQVGRPGAYDCSGSDAIGLLEAIGMAGGFTRIADRGHIIVKRQDGGSMKTIKVNAKKLTDTGVDRFEIHPGDVIDVRESWY